MYIYIHTYIHTYMDMIFMMEIVMGMLWYIDGFTLMLGCILMEYDIILTDAEGVSLNGAYPPLGHSRAIQISGKPPESHGLGGPDFPGFY